MIAETEPTDQADKIPVVYLIDFLSYGGGMENQLAWLLKNIDRRRFEPRLVCLRREKISNTKDVGCPIDHLGVAKLVSLKAVSAVFRLASLLRRHRTKILQIFSVDSNIVGVLAGRLAGVEQIVVCRRDMGLWYDSGPLKLVNRVNRFAHRCLVNSAAVKEAVVAHETFRLEQVHVIYNGIRPRAPVDEPPLTRTDLGAPEDGPLVGIVANLRPVKRIERLIRVLKQMQNSKAHLVIVGTGVQRESLQQQAASLGLSERVHFYHTVKRTLEVMRLFTVGALVSESEGLSNVLIEYGMSGVPAVAFDTGGNREVILAGKTGYLVPPYDEAAMARTIDSLLADPERIAQMGEAAAESAVERFSLAKMVASHQDFYLHILGRSKTATV